MKFMFLNYLESSTGHWLTKPMHDILLKNTLVVSPFPNATRVLPLKILQMHFQASSAKFHWNQSSFQMHRNVLRDHYNVGGKHRGFQPTNCCVHCFWQPWTLCIRLLPLSSNIKFGRSRCICWRIALLATLVTILTYLDVTKTLIFFQDFGTTVLTYFKVRLEWIFLTLFTVMFPSHMLQCFPLIWIMRN